MELCLILCSTALVLLLFVVVDFRDSVKELQHLLRDSEPHRGDELLFDVYTSHSESTAAHFLFQLSFIQRFCFVTCVSLHSLYSLCVPKLRVWTPQQVTVKSERSSDDY